MAIIKIEKGIKMKILEKFTLIGISMLFVVVLTACEKPGPAETAGKKIDETAAEASKKIDAAADKVREKLDK